jgi:hypothetical protein
LDYSAGSADVLKRKTGALQHMAEKLLLILWVQVPVAQTLS